MPAGFAADALRAAAVLGAELKDLALPKDKAGRTMVNAASVLRVLRSHQSRPLGEVTEDRIPRAEIDFAAGLVQLDGVPWLRPEDDDPGGRSRARCADPGRLPRQLPVVLRQCGRGGGGLLGVSGLALCGAGGALSAPGGGAGRHRSLGLSGLCGAVRPLERRQDAVHQDCRALDVRLREDDPQRPVHRQPGARPARAARRHPAADRRRDAGQVHQPRAGSGAHRPGDRRASMRRSC